MTALIAASVGGFFGFMLISALVSAFVFKRDEPEARALKTTIAAFVIVAILAGFGNADGEGFKWFAWAIYVPGAIGAYLFWRRHYFKKWDDAEEAGSR